MCARGVPWLWPGERLDYVHEVICTSELVGKSAAGENPQEVSATLSRQEVFLG